MFTINDYAVAIVTLTEGLGQLEPDGQCCRICGDSGHQAFECPHNPLVAIELKHAYRCFHCGKYFRGDAAKQHFGETENDVAECLAKGDSITKGEPK